MAIHLDAAADHDASQIFKWRNSPFLIERSTSKKLVSWEEHQAWFSLALKDENKRIYVISNDTEKLGIVRFDRVSPDICIISAYIMEEFTGRGFGVEAIKLGCQTIANIWAIKKIYAFVRNDNQAGRAGFLKAGFVRNNESELCPEAHQGLIYLVDKGLQRGWEIDDQWNVDYYTEQTRKYGIDSKSLNWGSRESQFLRFNILSQVLPSLKDMSILDVGCGLGDFCGWLKEKAIKVDYSGIDIVPEMLAIAQSRFSLDKFDAINLLAPHDALEADVVVASGIFAKRMHDPVDFLKSMISAMFNIAKCAVAFNSLSAWAVDKEEGEFYADPDETLRFCKTLTPWVALRHDYHSRDFTIYMYKSRNI